MGKTYLLDSNVVVDIIKGRLDLNQSIIASTAIVHDFTLITSDKVGFTKIPELKLINPLSA